MPKSRPVEPSGGVREPHAGIGMGSLVFVVPSPRSARRRCEIRVQHIFPGAARDAAAAGPARCPRRYRTAPAIVAVRRPAGLAATPSGPDRPASRRLSNSHVMATPEGGKHILFLLLHQNTLMLSNKFRCGPGRGAISAAFRQPSRQARSPGRRAALRPRRGGTPAACRPPFRAESKSPANPSGPCGRASRIDAFPLPSRPGRAPIAARPFFGAGQSVSSRVSPGEPAGLTDAAGGAHAMSGPMHPPA